MLMTQEIRDMCPKPIKQIENHSNQYNDLYSYLETVIHWDFSGNKPY